MAAAFQKRGWNLLLPMLVLVGGCSNESGGSPGAEIVRYRTLEEHEVLGRVTAPNYYGAEPTFVLEAARNGSVSLDPETGDFLFEPDVDFYGIAGFEYSVRAGSSRSPKSTISIIVANVNDPPRVSPIPDMENSLESEFVEYSVAVVDPDPDRADISLSVAVADPAIVDASIDEPSGLLRLRPLMVGNTTIDVTAADGEFSDVTTFGFTAQALSKEFLLSFSDPANGAVRLKNKAEVPVDFVLEHNGFPVFENLESIVAYVESMDPQFTGEDFGRKLWRFIRDSVYHDVPLNSKRWLYDPWVTINSLGWGFCGHVAGAFVEIARAAGYQARVWGLSGHVVPELEIDGAWIMYDPDLAVYYKTVDGRVAGVDELAANATLISEPVDPLFAGPSYQFPYSDFVAETYASTDDNFDGNETFLPAHEPPSARIVLPPGANLVYPGRWTEAPTGYDGEEPYVVRHYHQALLELEDGWTGAVTLPWMIWEAYGAGQVGVEGVAYELGSPELIDRLRDTDAPVTSLDVYAGTSVQIVFFINAVRFNILEQNDIRIRAMGAWAIEATAVELPPEVAAGARLDESLRKPRPTVIP